MASTTDCASRSWQSLYQWGLSHDSAGEPFLRELLTSDNPANSAYFSRLKTEWGEQFVEAETFEALHKLVILAIAYYNTERYHTSIGRQTPVQYNDPRPSRAKTIYTNHLTDTNVLQVGVTNFLITSWLLICLGDGKFLGGFIK